MPDVSAFSKLYGRVGRYSRYAGIGFIVLSVLFLVIAVSDQFIVFEIDSIIAFLAALVLLFKDPRARVQARVFDAVMGSTDEAIGELSASDAGFTYVPAGNGVEMVVIVPENQGGAALPNGAPSKAPTMEAITPPGRGLAKLYMREMGVTHLTMDVLRASLPEAMRENFGLARSVDIISTDDRVDVTLHGACQHHAPAAWDRRSRRPKALSAARSQASSESSSARRRTDRSSLNRVCTKPARARGRFRFGLDRPFW